MVYALFIDCEGMVRWLYVAYPDVLLLLASRLLLRCCCCMSVLLLSTVGCVMSCRAHCPCSCSLPPGYLFQVCIRLPYIDVGFTGLAFLSHPTYLPRALQLTLVIIHVPSLRHTADGLLQGGNRTSQVLQAQGALADISCCLLLSAYM
jgi:hypothetical protein